MLWKLGLEFSLSAEALEEGLVASRCCTRGGRVGVLAAAGHPTHKVPSLSTGSSRRVIVGALALAGLAAMPQALVTSVTELWALRLATSLFLGCIIPVANLAIKDAAPPERQGAAFGVVSSATSTGFALGPIGGGLLASTLGFWAAFLVPGAALLTLAAAFRLAWAPRFGSTLASWRIAIAQLTR